MPRFRALSFISSSNADDDLQHYQDQQKAAENDHSNRHHHQHRLSAFMDKNTTQFSKPATNRLSGQNQIYQSPQQHHRQHSRHSSRGTRDFSGTPSLNFSSPIEQEIASFSRTPGLPHSATEKLDGTESLSPSLNTNSGGVSRNSSILSSNQTPKIPSMEFPKDTPLEMIPILTLLACQQKRVYYEGYFMLLADLNAGEYIIYYFVVLFAGGCVLYLGQRSHLGTSC